MARTTASRLTHPRAADVGDRRGHPGRLLVINTSHGHRYADPPVAGAADLEQVPAQFDDGGVESKDREEQP